jgi:hypothetical protein
MSPVPGLTMIPHPANLPPDWREQWAERVAIMVHDGGLPLRQAEALALRDVREQMAAAGELPD